VITVQLPPLRDRKDDIPLLVQHFIDKYGEENHKPNSSSRRTRSIC
jgi:DNA-binding NtrC family response regulator